MEKVHQQPYHGDCFYASRSSRRRGARGRLRVELIDLIQAMATANGLWGAERIRGDLLKLGIRVSKRTVQKYMRSVRPRGQHGQTWGTFLRNHTHDIWACDVLQLYSPGSRSTRSLSSPTGPARSSTSTSPAPLPMGRSAAPRGYVRQRTAVLRARWQVHFVTAPQARIDVVPSRPT